jgi:hypothetical protein
MGRYDDAIAFLSRVEDPKEARMNSRDRFTSKQLAKLRREYPGVPEEYLDYLCEVGAGAFRECQFTVYGFLGLPSEICGLPDPSERFLGFGDNFAEWMSGFLPDERWTIGELGYGGSRVDRIKKPFGKYIRERMLMGPKGSDLRAK